jgi:hypothetical protein
LEKRIDLRLHRPSCLNDRLGRLRQPNCRGEATLPTDANLITAIDVSGSIGPQAEALEFDGIAQALLHPAFLETVAGGYHGRIGFAAFTWSSQGDFVTLVSWTLIDSEAAAGEVASRLHAALGKPRLGYATPSFGSARQAWRRNLATDISAAVEHATRLLANAPYAATREIINILANGTDNIADGPAAARDRALARGVVINGLSLGDDPEVAAYLRAHVQGGSGSFVLEARRPVDIASAMRRKFLLDLVGPLPDSILPTAGST